MPEIIVNINDQDYAIVCDPGEEHHLKHLSSKIDYKVRELTKRFGNCEGKTVGSFSVSS